MKGSGSGSDGCSTMFGWPCPAPLGFLCLYFMPLLASAELNPPDKPSDLAQVC